MCLYSSNRCSPFNGVLIEKGIVHFISLFLCLWVHILGLIIVLDAFISDLSDSAAGDVSIGCCNDVSWTW